VMEVGEIKKLYDRLNSDDTAFGHYLVRLGKPAWLLGHIIYCSAEDCDIVEPIILEKLQSFNRPADDIASTQPIPFTIKKLKEDGNYEFIAGLAAKPWIVDLIKWMETSYENLPAGIYDSIKGMICGYDLESIQKYIDNRVNLGKE